MKIRSLDELTAGDHRTRLFSGAGLLNGYEITPASAFERVQLMIADSDLGPQVPASVWQFFERCRELHVYGYFNYDFFSIAFEQAHLAIELALKVRFVEHYSKRVPLVQQQTGSAVELEVDTYAQLDEALRGAKKDWHLRGHRNFNGTLKSLFDWAIAERLLTGRSAAVAKPLRELRNFVAHPTSTRTVTPVDSAEAIRLTLEIINQLWGGDGSGPDRRTLPAGTSADPNGSEISGQ
jgi:hypothetical protein